MSQRCFTCKPAARSRPQAQRNPRPSGHPLARCFSVLLLISQLPAAQVVVERYLAAAGGDALREKTFMTTFGTI